MSEMLREECTERSRKLVVNGVIDELMAQPWGIAKLLSGCGTARQPPRRSP